jgi:hypothetical protein
MVLVDYIGIFLHVAILLATYYTHKTKDRVTRTPLKTGVNSAAPEG